MKRKNKGFFIRLFLKITLLFIVVSSSIYFTGIQVFVNKQKDIFKTNQKHKIRAEKNLMEHIIDDAVLDLMTMSKSSLFQLYFKRKVDDQFYLNHLEGLVKELFRQKPSYYQLRFIDLEGMEVFRLERVNGEARICDNSQLQDKSGRYYFQEAMKLRKGNFYVSPFDLNIEHGMVEKPYRPMIRICIPVFNPDDTKQGIFVLNYDGTGFILELDEHSKGKEGISYLINAQGYFLNADNPALEWGFMFPEKQHIKLNQIFPEICDQISQAEFGQFETHSGLFTFEAVNPFRHIGDLENSLSQSSLYQWKVISFVPANQLTWAVFVPLSKLIWLYALIVVIGMIAIYIFTDVSLKNKLAQQALIESERKLKLAVKAKDQFFSILSHDLKNASGTLVAYLEFMQEDFDNFTEDDKIKHLGIITNAASLHNKLLYNILDWARLQQGNDSQIKPVVFNVAGLFKEQADLLELQLNEKGLQIDIICDKGIQAFADKDMVKTIIRNLLSNAIKFSNRGGKIVLLAENKEDKVELKVIDQGIGMRASDAKRIFDISSKIQLPGTENESGTGFGLKLVGELVEKNLGTIRIESEIGKGSTFIVSLPTPNK